MPSGMPSAWLGWPRNAAGQREVSIELADGNVQADWLRAFSNLTASRAKASTFGLVSRP